MNSSLETFSSKIVTSGFLKSPLKYGFWKIDLGQTVVFGGGGGPDRPGGGGGGAFGGGDGIVLGLFGGAWLWSELDWPTPSVPPSVPTLSGFFQ